MKEGTDWLDRRIKEIEYKIGMIILGGIRCLLKFILGKASSL